MMINTIAPVIYLVMYFTANILLVGLAASVLAALGETNGVS